MNRFTLIHDGTNQGWNTAYLAFHVAARLGAPLQAVLVDANATDEDLKSQATQIETGARAAGVKIETQVVKDFSPITISESIATGDGLFVPHRLTPNGKAALAFLNRIHAPLWIVKEGIDPLQWGILPDKEIKNKDLLTYADGLSYRFETSLTGLITKKASSPLKKKFPRLEWHHIPGISLTDVALAVKTFHIDLLFLHASHASLVSKLKCACVVYPESLLK